MLDDASGPVILRRTKFAAPRCDARWVARPRLLAKLNGNLPRHLTLVTAPAGSGKTTLVRQWLAQRAEATDGVSAWLSLDQEDDTARRFFRCLIAAIRSVLPWSCHATQDLIAGAMVPPPTTLADALVNDLGALPQALTLILDDYHVISDPAVHAAMVHLIGHLPAGVDVVVTSRADPPWKLARMRALGHLVEVRAADLMFTLDEARALLEQPLARSTLAESADLVDDLIELLHARTEGWAVGLQLAQVSLREKPEPAAFAAGLMRTDRYVHDYLFEEVLSHQSSDVQSFLLATAIVDQFCVSLCEALCRDAVLPGAPSEEILADLERHNLFLIALDEDRTWFRYHHLFRDLLQRQLQLTDAPRIERLHLSASAWFEGEGLLEQAVTHAVLGSQPVRAARLIEREFPALVERKPEDTHTIRTLVACLPAEMLDARPALLAIQAYLAISAWDTRAMADYVSRADALIQHPPADMNPDEVEATRTCLDWLRGMALFRSGDLAAACEDSARALQHISPAQPYVRVLTLTYEAVARGMLGDVRTAVQSLEDELAKCANPADALPNLLLLRLCYLDIVSGDLDRLFDDATRLAMAWPQKSKAWMAWGHYCLGFLSHERFDLDAAVEHYQWVVDARYGANIRCVHESLAGLAWIRLVQGDAEGSASWSRQARAFAEEVDNAYARELAAALDTGLMLWQGETSAAKIQQHQLQQRTYIGVSQWSMEPRLRRAQLQIAGVNARALADAVADVRACLREAQHVRNAGRIIEARALLALGLFAQGDRAAALDSLAAALEIAARHGYVRTFVDLGPAMASLLARLRAGMGARSEPQVMRHVDRVLDAFRGRQAPLVEGAIGTVAEPHSWRIQTVLTTREREILALLAAQLSDEDIAGRLVLSVYTVKTHARNIYGKLQVANRREAVAKATALGILPWPLMQH